MKGYEELLIEGEAEGYKTTELPMRLNDGITDGKYIVIRRDIPTWAEKSQVMAEEIAHCRITVGDIMDTENNPENARQEIKARYLGYDIRIGLEGIIEAFEAGCKNMYEAAEHLGVTQQYLQQVIDRYRGKYGLFAKCGKYTIYFYPNLRVLRIGQMPVMTEHAG